MVYHALITEHISPVRIALGYDGFKSEFSFREGLWKFLKNRPSKRGLGPTSLPQLIISGDYALAKMNGQPYCVPSDKEWWHFITSSSVSPIRLILEYVWCRLVRKYPLGSLWGEDLDLERFHPCVKTRAREEDGIRGWDYEYVDIPKKLLQASQPPLSWEPMEVNQQQFVLFYTLCSGKEQRLSDPELISYIEGAGQSMDEFVDSLLSTGMIALDGEALRLTTDDCACAILPDGRYVVAENNTGRFTRWLSRFLDFKQPPQC